MKVLFVVAVVLAVAQAASLTQNSEDGRYAKYDKKAVMKKQAPTLMAGSDSKPVARASHHHHHRENWNHTNEQNLNQTQVTEEYEMSTVASRTKRSLHREMAGKEEEEEVQELLRTVEVKECNKAAKEDKPAGDAETISKEPEKMTKKEVKLPKKE